LGDEDVGLRVNWFPEAGTIGGYYTIHIYRETGPQAACLIEQEAPTATILFEVGF
jgi:hypothetical protein